MWFLEHEKLFGGKKVWLRPGSQHLFGRVSGAKNDDGKGVFIDHKAVSRQHMMIRVLEVPPDEGSNLFERSRVEVTDLSCRQGTVVDGQTLKSKKEGGSVTSYDKTILGGTEHTIVLAANYPGFRIKWQPIVFTYAQKDTDKQRNANLHKLDIKTTKDLVYGQTSHVVSAKRNLPKVLHGLVVGAYIVTDRFLDDLIKVGTPQNEDPENYKESKLEADFVTCWPKEEEYIPPVDAEPVPRPQEHLLPNPRRCEVFSGLTFVFFQESQYNILENIITGGGGKIMLFPLKPGETTVDEYVEYVSNATGEKWRGRASNVPLSVITIRFLKFPEGMEEWATNFVTGVDQKLNQRSIQQNEFLDAIIENDASPLQKPPEIVAGSGTSANENTAPALPEPIPAIQTRRTSLAQGSTAVETEEPPKTINTKRPRGGRGFQSRFKNFDDLDDDDDCGPASKKKKVDTDILMEDERPSSPTQSSYQRPQVESQGPAQSTQTLRPSQTQPAQSIQTLRPSQTQEMEERVGDAELFPAAAIIKKRRAATSGVSAPVEPEASASTSKPKSEGAIKLEQLQKKRKDIGKDIDVRQLTRLRVQAEEEKGITNEKDMQKGLQGIEISEVRRKIQIEEMDIAPRQSRPAQQTDASGDRWDDAWNGRKNFKRFRRRGEQIGPELPKTVIALEEAVPKKGFGAGDAFFLEEPERAQRGNGRAAAQDSESEPEPGLRLRRRSYSREVSNVENSERDKGEDVPARSASGTNSTQRVAETQASGTQTQRKRGPAGVAAGQPPSKKSKAKVTRRDDDDSDEEETGFRFVRV